MPAYEGEQWGDLIAVRNPCTGQLEWRYYYEHSRKATHDDDTQADRPALRWR